MFDNFACGAPAVQSSFGFAPSRDVVNEMTRDTGVVLDIAEVICDLAGNRLQYITAFEFYTP